MQLVVVENLIQDVPALMELTEEQILERKDREEDQGMEDNIQQISLTWDLSPRHSIKLGDKQPKDIIPLQVRTRSNKEKVLAIDQ